MRASEGYVLVGAMGVSWAPFDMKSNTGNPKIRSR